MRNICAYFFFESVERIQLELTKLFSTVVAVKIMAEPMFYSPLKIVLLTVSIVYAWFLGHNLDLWMLSLPLVDLPLLFKRSTNEKQLQT